MTSAVIGWQAFELLASVVSLTPSFVCIKQGLTESFDQFADRVQTAIMASEVTSEAQDPMLKECLMSGDRELFQDVLAQLSASCIVAEMIEVGCRAGRQEEIEPLTMAVQAAQQPLLAALQVMTGEVGGQPHCFVCNGTGHLKRDCPKSVLSVRLRNIPCWVCGRPHVARTCPNCKDATQLPGNREPQAGGGVNTHPAGNLELPNKPVSVVRGSMA